MITLNGGLLSQTYRPLHFGEGRVLAGNSRFVIANISGYCTSKYDPLLPVTEWLGYLHLVNLLRCE